MDVFTDESLLSDDYPVYVTYLYVVDGSVVQSMITGTVRDLRRDLVRHGWPHILEVRRCNTVARSTMIRGEPRVEFVQSDEKWRAHLGEAAKTKIENRRKSRRRRPGRRIKKWATS